ncbi:MAG: hypothetical protein AVDCRST_MAG68-5076 [uncultured Gemmatimonadetes bacterium]|uniref:Uncharacterized protein n=1 Tax=uncultured Gemmatimonadota bacterium TaxID=203437 RepID=A0A6J4MP12_9BACT|nr:MAG: hypothetical protein AVDCRST_MAG68-5076 [uncultured Gemmatimonadota bacterium]
MQTALAELVLIAESRTRAVYDRGDGYVVKVALNHEGFIANSREANWTSTEVPLAPCWFEWPADGGDAVLVMEKIVRFVESIDEYNALPRWTGFVDCAQVGYLADGRLVAYDL